LLLAAFPVHYLAFDPFDILPVFYLEQAHNAHLAAAAVPALSQEAQAVEVERVAAKAQKHLATVVQGC